MSTYIGKAVLVTHRVATGHAGLRNAGAGVRRHVPVPTELQTHFAIVIGESAAKEGDLVKLTVTYKKTERPISPIEIGSEFATMHDVPHRDDEGAEESGLYWVPTTETTDDVLQEIADEGAVKPTADGLPSGADLDADAEEKKAKDATSGQDGTVDESKGSLGAGAGGKPGIRVVKGSKGK